MMEGFLEIIRRYRDAFAQAWKERHDNKASSRRKAEADFLPAVLEVQESPPNPLARATVYVIIAFFVLALLWMTLGKIDIVATAPGKIIPDNRIKIVQAAEGGVVRQILVKDGDKVQMGQTLFLLDETHAHADEAATAELLLGLRLEEEMATLLSQATGKNVPRLLGEGIDGARVSSQQEVLVGIYREHRQRLARIDSEAETVRRRLEGERRGVSDTAARMKQAEKILASREEREQQQIRKMEALLPLAEEQYKTSRDLLEIGAVSRLQMQEAQEKYISLSEDLVYRRRALEEIRESGAGRQMEMEQESGQYETRIREAEARLATLERERRLAESTFRREMRDRREVALREIIQREQELVKLRESKKRHEITAPVGGIVQQLALHTEGGVVQPAQALLVIVPEKPVLEIEAKVKNQDIGFVREGQRVEVKVDAFPYTKYGLIGGLLEDLSADAIEDQAFGLVYQARVQMDVDTILAEGREVRLTPGMSVVVEIKTGERRVIEFFLSPLLRHGRESLGER